jgi:plasmid stability protein
MADLLIRDIDVALKRRLEELARKHGRSLSEEAKLLIRRAVAEAPSEVGLGTRLFSMLPDEFRGDDLVFEVPNDVAEPPGFE